MFTMNLVLNLGHASSKILPSMTTLLISHDSLFWLFLMEPDSVEIKQDILSRLNQMIYRQYIIVPSKDLLASFGFSFWLNKLSHSAFDLWLHNLWPSPLTLKNTNQGAWVLAMQAQVKVICWPHIKDKSPMTPSDSFLFQRNWWNFQSWHVWKRVVNHKGGIGEYILSMSALFVKQSRIFSFLTAYQEQDLWFNYISVYFLEGFDIWSMLLGIPQVWGFWFWRNMGTEIWCKLLEWHSYLTGVTTAELW